VSGSSHAVTKAGRYVTHSRFVQEMTLVSTRVLQMAVAVDCQLDATASRQVLMSSRKLYGGAGVLTSPSSQATRRAVFVTDCSDKATFSNKGRIWGSILVGLSASLMNKVRSSQALCSGRLLYVEIGDVHCLFIYGVLGASSSADKQAMAHDLALAVKTITASLPPDARILVAGDLNAVHNPHDRGSQRLHAYDTAPYSLPPMLHRMGLVDVHRELQLKSHGEQHFSFFSKSQETMSRIDQLW
jgi:exonuclease III